MTQETVEKPKAKGRGKLAEAGTNGRADIDAAHAALGTGADVAGSEHFDPAPQDIHGGDGLDAGGGEPVSQQLSFAVGGKKPTSCGLRLVGGKVEIEEVFRKGQTIRLSIVAEVGEIAFVDERDSATGQVVGCQRRQKARITSVTVED